MMENVPEVKTWITSEGWTATCLALDCKWTDYATERTENWMDEMLESIQRHKQWHEDGCPE